jgi:hypothetical protein
LLITNYTARLLGTARDLAGHTIDGNFNRSSDGSPADDFVWDFHLQPQNDDFSNATVLTGTQGSLNANTTGASLEPDEPLANDRGFTGALSLWYQWSGVQDGWMTFDSSSSDLDTVVAAYTGSTMASLVEVAFNDDYRGKIGGKISFPVVAGTNYFITVASRLSKDPPVGPITLAWYPTPPPGFTFGFSPTRGLSGTKITLNGTNFIGATAVLFNGASASFTNNVDFRITATVPPDATDGPITIRTPHGDATSSNSFLVLIPQLLARNTASGAVEISWGATATNITLEAVANLDQELWAPVPGPLIRTNGHTVFQPDASLGNRFYRLRRQ